MFLSSLLQCPHTNKVSVRFTPHTWHVPSQQNPEFLSWYNNSSSTCSPTTPHKTPAYTAETTQVLYFDFTKAIVLVSLPLDLIALLAPALSGSFIPDMLDHARYHIWVLPAIVKYFRQHNGSIVAPLMYYIPPATNRIGSVYSCCYESQCMWLWDGIVSLIFWCSTYKFWWSKHLESDDKSHGIHFRII